MLRAMISKFAKMSPAASFIPMFTLKFMSYLVRRSTSDVLVDDEMGIGEKLPGVQPAGDD